MKEILNKFIDYLKNSSYFLTQSVIANNCNLKIIPIENEIMNVMSETGARLNAARYLEIGLDNASVSGEALANFSFLSKVIMESPLKNRERVKILFYIMQQNIEAGMILETQIPYTTEEVNSYDFKYINKDEALKFLKSEECVKLYHTSDELLSEEQRLIKRELLDFISSLPPKIDNIIEAHKIVNDSYFSKIDSFESDDINIIISAIKIMDVSDELVDLVFDILNVDLRKRLKKKEDYVYVSKLDNVKYVISDKERNVLSRELRKYFNFYKMEPFKILSFDEQIYCVSLMLKLDMEDSLIRDFLRITSKSQKDLNVFSLFNQLYNKLKYYDSNVIIKNALDNMLSIFSQIFIVDSDEYVEWKEMFDTELKLALQEIPKGYEYELSLAKRTFK